MFFCRFLEKNHGLEKLNSWKDGISKNWELRDLETQVFGAVSKNDVWKYLRTVVMGLYAVCEQKLAHPDRVLSLLFIHVACLRMCILFYFYFVCQHVCMSSTPRSIAGVPSGRALPGFPITAHHLCAFLV